jgi:glycosyltransferase involved in cell wall biosynthesis
MRMNTGEPAILHPEHFITPFYGGSYKDSLAVQAEKFIGNTDFTDIPPVSVVIRTKNDEFSLLTLMHDLQSQIGNVDTQLIVVDTESTDSTPSVAKAYGAELVTIPQSEFTYPEALNRGFERADNPVVFSLVGHVALATNVAVAAGADHFKEATVVGVFAPPLPTLAASTPERWFSIHNATTINSSKRLDKVGTGVMGATNAMFRKDAWEELGGFDNKYAAGGEDTEFARRMLANGNAIDREPLLTVHHSHGLGLKNTLAQWRHWKKVAKGPVEFNAQELAKRRPDLGLGS